MRSGVVGGTTRHRLSKDREHIERRDPYGRIMPCPSRLVALGAYCPAISLSG